MCSKEVERKALEKIEAILKQLGTTEDSYVCKAMDGCIETARLNIENDFFCSYKQARDTEEEKSKALAERLVEMQKDYDKLFDAFDTLQKRYERELEWKHYEESNVYSQVDYDNLRKVCNQKELSEEAALDLVCNYGFDRSKIHIITTVPVYEINRHHALRQCGLIDRKPFYFASDWNCIVFECGGYVHELQNGEVRFNNRDFA